MGMLVLTGKTGMTAAVKRGKTPWAWHIIERAIQLLAQVDKPLVPFVDTVGLTHLEFPADEGRTS